MEFIKELFHLSYREGAALDKMAQAFKSMFSQGFSFKQITASIMVIVEMLSFILFAIPMTPRGEALDLRGYTQVFCDDFNGSELDASVWNYRGSGARRGGYNSPNQVRLEDGNLKIRAQYREDGEFGPGWYVGMVSLREKYKQGYFEARCICSDGSDFWSAFWIQADHPYEPEISKGGIGGAELDIFEAMNADEKTGLKRNGVTSTIHCSGMTGDTSGGLNSRNLGTFRGKDIYRQYNTYGLKWTEDEYIFYINGVETVRSSFADGVSQVPEEVIVSLEIPDGEIHHDKDYSTEFIIDYVKIWQKL